MIVLMIAPLGLTASFWSDHHLSKGLMILISIFTVIGILGFIRVWFSSGDVVRLKEDSIMKAPGRCPYESLYKKIESCNVCHDSYNNTKFSVLKFTIKKRAIIYQLYQLVKLRNLPCLTTWTWNKF